MKFCTFGFVSSNTWSTAYVSIQDGFLRIYDSENTCRTQPRNIVTEIYLDEGYYASTIKVKDYSVIEGKVININYIYIEYDNGFWMPSKIIKLGCFDAGDTTAIKAAIDSYKGIQA